MLSLSRNTHVRDAMLSWSATRSMVQRYVAGETVESAVSTAQSLHDGGMKVTLDYLGEDVTEAAQAEIVKGKYLDLLASLQERGLTEDGNVEVSVKLTALGSCLDQDVAEQNLRAICQAAADVGTTVTVDMEDHTLTDDTLQMVRKLRTEFPWLGAVLQSYLHRTLTDCEQMSGPQTRTRLCKGAYNEPATVAFQKPHDVDTNYVRCLSALMAAEGLPMVASHDPRLLAIAETLATHHHRSNDEWEVQMLFGVRPDEQRRLAALGRTVRVYVPFGDDWYGYLTRRLAERPANMMLFMRSLVGSK